MIPGVTIEFVDESAYYNMSTASKKRYKNVAKAEKINKSPGFSIMTCPKGPEQSASNPK